MAWLDLDAEIAEEFGAGEMYETLLFETAAFEQLKRERDNRRARRPNNTMVLTCERPGCGKKFEFTRQQFGGRYKRYCSMNCKWKVCNDKTRTHPPDRPCAICGKQLSYNKTGGRPPAACYGACYKKLRAQQVRESRRRQREQRSHVQQ